MPSCSICGKNNITRSSLRADSSFYFYRGGKHPNNAVAAAIKQGGIPMKNTVIVDEFGFVIDIVIEADKEVAMAKASNEK